MSDDDIINAMMAMDSTRLTGLFDKMARMFSVKAERVFAPNQEENGWLAQPYADLESLCAEAATVFQDVAEPSMQDIDEASVVEEDLTIPAPPVTKGWRSW